MGVPGGLCIRGMFSPDPAFIGQDALSALCSSLLSFSSMNYKTHPAFAKPGHAVADRCCPPDCTPG